MWTSISIHHFWSTWSFCWKEPWDFPCCNPLLLKFHVLGVFISVLEPRKKTNLLHHNNENQCRKSFQLSELLSMSKIMFYKPAPTHEIGWDTVHRWCSKISKSELKDSLKHRRNTVICRGGRSCHKSVSCFLFCFCLTDWRSAKVWTILLPCLWWNICELFWIYLRKFYRE